jgi:hypothetical protein
MLKPIASILRKLSDWPSLRRLADWLDPIPPTTQGGGGPGEESKAP